MKDWRRTFAVWMHVTKGQLSDAPFGAMCRSELGCLLGCSLDNEQAEWLEPVRFRITDDIPHNASVLLAETRALVLRIPNPFPLTFDEFLFPRWTWLRRRLRGAA